MAGITTSIRITDEGTATLKKIREETRSFKEELSSTKQELKATWDKKYKPAIENTSAMKSIKDMQKKADDFKDSLNTKVRLNDSEMKKVDAMQSKLKAFGSMVVSPFIRIKDTAMKTINNLYQRLLKVGSMVVAPIVKVKDNALSKLKSSIKLFEELGKKVISPVIRLKDYASNKLRSMTSVLTAIGTKTIQPVIRIKDAGIEKLKNTVNSIKNKTISIATRIRDFASPKLNAIKTNLLFLAKLSIQPAVKLYDLATSGIKNIQSGLSSLAKRTVNAVVNLKGNAISQISSIKSKLTSLGKKTFSPVIKLKDSASSKIRKVTSEVTRVGKIIARPAIVLKDSVTRLLSPIGSKLKAIGGKAYKATITAIDKTKAGITSAVNGLASVAKKMVIPVTVMATVATAGLGATVKSGMDLEQQQISIEHFIGATNKDYGEAQIKEAAQTFTEQLRQNANATPFETGEVISAGSRAVSITQGNTKEAMSLVKLAEDMAAASGGTKSVSDAMEALADAKMGEMERLKEFGFKVSADEFQQKGFEGVSKDLEDFYGGAAGKLATSGAGLVSTITGKLKSAVSDFGLKIVDQLKPVLTGIIGLIDQALPYIEEFGTKFGDSLGKGIQYISSLIPSFVNGFKQMMPTIQVLIAGVQQMLPPIMAFGGTVVTTIQNIVVQATPVIAQIITTIGQILPAVEPIFSTIITTVGNIVTTVLPPLGSAFQLIGEVITTVAPVVSEAFGIISEVVTTAVSGISSIIQGGLDLISSVWSGSWSGMVSAFSTIFGGIAEICKAPINAVISIINKAIDGINSIAVDIPDWVPVVGGKHFGMDLGHIPKLATGGVVNQATTAVIGEAGKEAVMPLERNTGWIAQLSQQIMSRMNGMSISLPVVNNQIPISNGNSMSPSGSGKTISVVITIAKLADSIIVKEKEDIEEISEKVAEKILEVVENM